ncbi:hypothetical protein D1871_09420 [Nakamurella silvestris]|nr:hypothetical protein D1871_09420 [Nakamurella silvestris]
MTDPELDAQIVAAARMDREQIDRITAGMPDLAEGILAEEIPVGRVEDENASGTADLGAADSDRPTAARRRAPWIAVVGIAAGVALIAVAVTAVVSNVADSPAIGPTGPVVTGPSTAAPAEPPTVTVLPSKPVVPEDGLTQQERNARRAVLTPYFQQLTKIDGFVDGNFDLKASRLEVAFQDAVPADAAAVAAQAADEGASVDLTTVAFSEDQMMKATEPLSVALRAAGVQASVFVAEDYRSIEIATVFLAQTPALQEKVVRVAAPIVGRIPLTLYSLSADGMMTATEQPDPPDFDRPAWEARARIESSPGWTGGRFDMNARYELVIQDQGSVTAESTAAVQAIEELGVTVVVKPASGPRVFGIGDIENVLTNVMMGLPDQGFDITVFGPTADLTGVYIGGPEISTSPQKQEAFLAAVKSMGYDYLPVTFVPAELAPGQAKSAVQQQFEAQAQTQSMQAEADPYWEAISAMKGFRDGGYGTDGPAGAQKATLFFNWEGQVPQKAKDLAAEAAAKGIKITFILSKYTEAEIMAAAEPLVKELQRRSIDIYSIGPAANYTGLRLGGPELSYSKDLQAQVREIAKDFLGDMPLSFEDHSDDVQNMIDGILPTVG